LPPKYLYIIDIYSPVKLVDISVKASSNKNDIVFDSFVGSGTVAVSAKKKQKKIYWF